MKGEPYHPKDELHSITTYDKDQIVNEHAVSNSLLSTSIFIHILIITLPKHEYTHS